MKNELEEKLPERIVKNMIGEEIGGSRSGYGICSRCGRGHFKTGAVTDDDGNTEVKTYCDVCGEEY